MRLATSNRAIKQAGQNAGIPVWGTGFHKGPHLAPWDPNFFVLQNARCLHDVRVVSQHEFDEPKLLRTWAHQRLYRYWL